MHAPDQIDIERRHKHLARVGARKGEEVAVACHCAPDPFVVDHLGSECEDPPGEARLRRNGVSELCCERLSPLLLGHASETPRTDQRHLPRRHAVFGRLVVSPSSSSHVVLALPRSQSLSALLRRDDARRVRVEALERCAYHLRTTLVVVRRSGARDGARNSGARVLEQPSADQTPCPPLPQRVRNRPAAARRLLEGRAALQQPVLLVVEPRRRRLLCLLMLPDHADRRTQQVRVPHHRDVASRHCRRQFLTQLHEGQVPFRRNLQGSARACGLLWRRVRLFADVALQKPGAPGERQEVDIDLRTCTERLVAAARAEQGGEPANRRQRHAGVRTPGGNAGHKRCKLWDDS